MAKDQSEYFKEKHVWSRTKDSILSCYLTPFFQKVMTASPNGIVYVDGFSGAGKFESGEPGSPLIAIQKFREAHRKSRPKPPVQFVFAEAKRSARTQLETNVRQEAGGYGFFQDDHIRIVSNCNDAIAQANRTRLKNDTTPSTYFYYVDPYGIKDLRLESLSQSPVMDHTESLVNFCSVGFIRDACAALKIAAQIPEEAIDFSEAFSDDIPYTERMERLTAALGTEEWIGLIRRFGNKEIDFWEAEREVTDMFCASASRNYRYVTNMPIKDMSKKAKSGGLLKYRLVHMTNYHDGCVLMNDNMLKRNKELQTSHDSLFLLDVDGAIVETDDIRQAMLSSVMSHPIGEKVTMWELLAPVVSHHGVFLSSTDLLKICLSPLIDSGLVERVQKLTPTGRPCTAFSKGDKRRVFRTR